MIDFSGYTAKAIEKAMLGRVSNSLDKREGSLIQTAIGPAAWYIEGMYMVLDQLQQNAFASTAVGQALDYKALERGIMRKGATLAVRRGEFDAPVPAGARFSAMNSREVLTYKAVKELEAGEGFYCYEMESETPGRIGNEYTGPILPITHVKGLKKAVLTDILISGTDEETDESLRNRYMESLTSRPFGGNIAAYRSEILQIDGVGAVQVYPVWKGGGTVLCSILDSEYNAATDSLISRVQNRICPPGDRETNVSENGYGMAPIGAKVTITTATELALSIELTVQIQAGTDPEHVRGEIRQAAEEYLFSVRKGWGSGLVSHRVEYPVPVYIARLNYAILNVPGIVNVSHTMLNGSGEDIMCLESAQMQQIPVLGEVLIHAD